MKYDYRCKECAEITELRHKVEDLDKIYLCSCGGQLERIILSAPTVSLDPVSGHFVTATDRWAKGRERKMAKERHNMKEHGTYT